ncbi:energy transducer TonB [Nitrosophilus kaiyonis]|uniref:energy transducer TonB n=1 Tax=Nitrosophilus kaiyonis TaxID=2930200 RepID=UPI0024927A0A|nr:energy transducer TonB [Nitrosophilus kaiyonis]
MKKSFFISLIIHTILFSSFIFLTNNLTPKEKIRTIKISSIKEEKVCRCNKTCQCTKKIEKKVIKKKKPKPKPKPKSKPIIKKKKTKKKILKLKPKKSIIKPKKIKKIVQKPKPKPKKVVKETKPLKPIKKENINEKIELPNKKIVKNEIKSSKKIDSHVKKANLNEKKDELEKIVIKIKKAIEENKKYPRIAKRLKKEGIVEVEFILCTDGKIKDLKIIKKASSILNKSAIKTIKKASIYFPKPYKNLKIVVPIEYKLTQI